MRVLIYFFWGIFLLGCGAKLTLPQEPKIQGELNASFEWWRTYEDKNLNHFLSLVLEHNSEINIAKTTLLTALARADLMDYDFYPSLSGNLGLSANKNIHQGVSAKGFSNKLSLNYELDIYGKISDSVKAAEFEARASAFDWQALKLSIVNRALNYIFELAYFNDVDRLLREYEANLEELTKLYTLKYALGRAEELDKLNAEQSLLQARQNLLSNEQNRNLVLKNLKDLVGRSDNFSDLLYFETMSLENFKPLKLDFNVPLQNLAFRPDVRASLDKLKAAFKDYAATQKSILPSISLGGVLSGEAKNFKDSFKFEILGGNIALSLPFLDYGRVRQNIKISQFAYEALRFSYEQNLQSAMNEFVLVAKDYESNLKMLENLKRKSEKQEQITRAYKEKYQLGKSELKDYLDASNALNASKREVLGAKFNLFKTINAYYQTTTLATDADLSGL